MSTHKGMLAARVFAVLVIAGVGAAAFRLSFATLRDLAVLAHIPHGDAYLFPLIIDGTIVQATAGMLVLANSPERRFFTRVLIVGAVVSVAGNAIHAIAAGHVLPSWLCAVVAAIAPISLLVDTHGLAVLFRAAQHHSSPATVPVPAEVAESTESTPASVPAVAEQAPTPVPAAVPTAVRAVRSVPAPQPVSPVRPVRPVQQMLPIAVPARS